MRELKFRAYFNDQMSHPFTLGEAVCWPCGKVSTANRIGVVMQYIGITDSDGVEVFQGDIIVVRQFMSSKWSETGAEVVFSNEYVGGWVISIGGQNLNLGTRTENIKVIGNIHENPELLNNKSK